MKWDRPQTKNTQPNGYCTVLPFASLMFVVGQFTRRHLTQRAAALPHTNLPPDRPPSGQLRANRDNGAVPARQSPDQPQHATRMLTVGDPIKVKAGFGFSAAASSASSATSKARRSSPPCSGSLMVSVIVPIRLRAALPPAGKDHHSKLAPARKIGATRRRQGRDRRLSAPARRDTIGASVCRFAQG